MSIILKNCKEVFRAPIFWLIFLAFLNKVVFTAIVPIWHTPDEQAHFAQVSYFAEYGSMPRGGNLDLSKEIYQSEVLLSTDRDKNGNNKYTYHPEYNIEYTNSFEGEFERVIKNFDLNDRKIMVGYEAARYPPLYYVLAAAPYKVLYNSNLIDRVYFSRSVSIILGLATIYVAFMIGKLIFRKSRLLPITLASLVAFHPMFTFVTVGVTSDNLLNFLFAIVIYLGLLILKDGITKRYIVWLILLVISLYFTKPQFILSLPILLISVFIHYLFVSRTDKKTFKWGILVVGFLMSLIFYLGSKNADFFEFIEKFYSQDFFPGYSNNAITALDFIKITLNKTAHETIPWYFGVFKWLSLVQPIEIIRIINRILLVVGIGILVKFIFIVKNKKTLDGYNFIFLITASLVYFMGIMYYDFLKYSSLHFSFGIQGRYFFPLIVAHMAICIVALLSLLPERFKNWGERIIKILSVLMVALNLETLWLLSKSYYEVSGVNDFIVQVSQYKPDIFKGGWIAIWFIMFLFFLIMLGTKYLKMSDNDVNKLNNMDKSNGISK